MNKATTAAPELTKIIDTLRTDLRLRTELARALGIPTTNDKPRHRRKGKKLYIAAHVGRPFGVSGVMVNRLALDVLNLQNPKHKDEYMKCVGQANEDTTRGIDAYMYTAKGVKKVREEIPRALRKGLIKPKAHTLLPKRRVVVTSGLQKKAA